MVKNSPIYFGAMPPCAPSYGYGRVASPPPHQPGGAGVSASCNGIEHLRFFSAAAGQTATHRPQLEPHGGISMRQAGSPQIGSHWLWDMNPKVRAVRLYASSLSLDLSRPRRGAVRIHIRSAVHRMATDVEKGPPEGQKPRFGVRFGVRPEPLIASSKRSAQRFRR